MGVEVLALLVTVVFGLAGVAAAYYGYKSFQASREQLELAHEQASRVPRLVLTGAALLPLSADHELEKDVVETRELLQEIEEERVEKRRAEEERLVRERERKTREREERERKEREREERRSGGFDASKLQDMGKPGERADLGRVFRSPFKDMAERLAARPMFEIREPAQIPMPSLYPKSEPYEGPLPDSFVEVGLKNEGRAAAYEVTGWLELDGADLESVDYFADRGVDLVSENGDVHKVELRAQQEGGRLLPSENDRLVFRVPVLRRRASGTTRLRYEFTSPQGGDAEGVLELALDPAEER